MKWVPRASLEQLCCLGCETHGRPLSPSRTQERWYRKAAGQEQPKRAKGSSTIDGNDNDNGVSNNLGNNNKTHKIHTTRLLCSMCTCPALKNKHAGPRPQEYE
ncbi:unnamed protein product, partial [Ectocarpus sp. 8 AP-2014]